MCILLTDLIRKKTPDYWVIIPLNRHSQGVSKEAWSLFDSINWEILRPVLIENSSASAEKDFRSSLDYTCLLINASIEYRPTISFRPADEEAYWSFHVCPVCARSAHLFRRRGSASHARNILFYAGLYDP